MTSNQRRVNVNDVALTLTQRCFFKKGCVHAGSCCHTLAGQSFYTCISAPSGYPSEPSAGFCFDVPFDTLDQINNKNK